MGSGPARSSGANVQGVTGTWQAYDLRPDLCGCTALELVLSPRPSVWFPTQCARSNSAQGPRASRWGWIWHTATRPSALGWFRGLI